MENISPSKLSLKQKVAIVFVIMHLVYVALAFHRDNKIFANPVAYCTMHVHQVGMPFPILAVSEIYYFIPAIYFDKNIVSEESPRLIRYSGTGGPCTYATINSALPYSLIFILVSSVAYYLLGLLVGSMLKYFKSRRDI